MKYLLFFLSVFFIFSCKLPEQPIHHSKVIIQQHWEDNFKSATITYDTINVVWEDEITLYQGSLSTNNGNKVIAYNVSFFSILSDSIVLIKR